MKEKRRKARRGCYPRSFLSNLFRWRTIWRVRNIQRWGTHTPGFDTRSRTISRGVKGTKGRPFGILKDGICFLTQRGKLPANHGLFFLSPLVSLLSFLPFFLSGSLSRLSELSNEIRVINPLSSSCTLCALNDFSSRVSKNSNSSLDSTRSRLSRY